MKGKIGDKERLGHILDAITEIESYTNNVSLGDFLANSMMRFASIKQIEIIGEAANYITLHTRALFTDIEWKQIIGMRHILIHEYFGVDSQLVWQVICNDIPNLKAAILGIYNALNGPDHGQSESHAK
jgi:uncharacterized protein with HEPN domain